MVAQEVRALAQRSATAAKDIKQLILASSRQVGEGVELVGETGKALDRIVRHIDQLGGMLTQITTSSKEQSYGLGQVNEAINEMDKVTQQNAAMVEQATAASHALSLGAEGLAAVISQFNLGADAPQAARGRRAA